MQVMMFVCRHLLAQSSVLFLRTLFVSVMFHLTVLLILYAADTVYCMRAVCCCLKSKLVDVVEHCCDAITLVEL